jgi:hypothetical protein
MVGKIKRFNDQETRDKIHGNITKIEKRLNSINNDEEKHEIWNDALKIFLPKEQLKYANTWNFIFLCSAYKKFQESGFHMEKKQEFVHAKENFDNYCEMMKIYES